MPFQIRLLCLRLSYRSGITASKIHGLPSWTGCLAQHVCGLVPTADGCVQCPLHLQSCKTTAGFLGSCPPLSVDRWQSPPSSQRCLHVTSDRKRCAFCCKHARALQQEPLYRSLVQGRSGEPVSDEHTLMGLPGRAAAGTLPCWESAQIQDRWPLRRDSEETTRLTVRGKSLPEAQGREARSTEAQREKDAGNPWGVQEAETEQRLEGEGHLPGNHWQESVRRVREALAGSEAWCPPGLQLPRVLGRGLHSDRCLFHVHARHWPALKHLSKSLPRAAAWRMHSFSPDHPTAAKGYAGP